MPFEIKILHEDLGKEVLRPFRLGIAEEGFWRVVFLNIAISHEPDAVGNGLGEAHFMGYHDHRHSLVGQFLHHVQHFTDHFGVKG